MALLTATAVAFAPDAFAQGRRTPKTFNVVPITITSVVADGGQLVAHGAVGTTPFTAPLTLTADQVTTAATCPVLHLALGPIHVGLLGLNIDTSAICLDITATEGGGLLGDLLCSISTALSAGTPLSAILDGLSTTDLDRLDAGLTQLLNQAVFIPLSSNEAIAGASCNVLNLELGPLTLNLLGLNVELDNCANGPITLDITATPGGGLLGDLLCNLANLLNNPSANAAAILGALRQIAVILGQILA
jgi:hypothetical protein